MTDGICVMLFMTGGFSVGKLPAESHFVVTGLKIKRGMVIADDEVRLAPLAGYVLALNSPAVWPAFIVPTLHGSPAGPP